MALNTAFSERNVTLISQYPATRKTAVLFIGKKDKQNNSEQTVPESRGKRK